MRRKERREDALYSWRVHSTQGWDQTSQRPGKTQVLAGVATSKLRRIQVSDVQWKLRKRVGDVPGMLRVDFRMIEDLERCGK